MPSSERPTPELPPPDSSRPTLPIDSTELLESGPWRTHHSGIIPKAPKLPALDEIDGAWTDDDDDASSAAGG